MLGGILISTLPIITTNVVAIINDGAIFDWKTPTTLIIGALSTWVVASCRNYINNK